MLPASRRTLVRVGSLEFALGDPMLLQLNREKQKSKKKNADVTHILTDNLQSRRWELFSEESHCPRPPVARPPVLEAMKRNEHFSTPRALKQTRASLCTSY